MVMHLKGAGQDLDDLSSRAFLYASGVHDHIHICLSVAVTATNLRFQFFAKNQSEVLRFFSKLCSFLVYLSSYPPVIGYGFLSSKFSVTGIN